MAKGIFIVGTDTNVGKTIVAAGLIHLLRTNGYNAVYFKAALSGALERDNELIPGDTELVSKAAKLEEPYENITPYIYKEAVSPHLAGKLENNPMNLEVVQEKYDYLKRKYDYIVAEGSGGIVCPLINDERGIYTLGDLIKDLNMTVIIVARAAVGTINHSVLTVKYIESLGIKIRGIIINNYEDGLLCDDNISIIERLTNVSVIGKLRTIEDLESNRIKAIRAASEKAFNLHRIIESMGEI